MTPGLLAKGLLGAVAEFMPPELEEKFAFAELTR